MIGSSSFVLDRVLAMADPGQGSRGVANLQLVENLVDWAVVDPELLKIRSRATFARTLLPLDAGQRQTWELGNYGAVVAALLILGLAAWWRRGHQTPMALSPASGRGSGEAAVGRSPTEVES